MINFVYNLYPWLYCRYILVSTNKSTLGQGKLRRGSHVRSTGQNDKDNALLLLSFLLKAHPSLEVWDAYLYRVEFWKWGTSMNNVIDLTYSDIVKKTSILIATQPKYNKRVSTSTLHTPASK